MSDRPSNTYQCPGERYPISRAVHLGRLASFYPKCQECSRREETGTLSQRHVKRLAEVWDRGTAPSLFTDEGAAGRYLNLFTPSVAEKMAVALGMHLRSLVQPRKCDNESSPVRPARPSVVIGSDTRVLSPELFSAVTNGLRWADCDVVDAGSATAASLAFVIDHVGADGGLLVGNPPGLPHTAGLKFWGPAARPFSGGGSLDRIRALYEGQIDRPARRSGGLRSVRIDAQYRESLRPYFHALRPLKFVLDTSCDMIADHLRSLCENVCVEIVPARRGFFNVAEKNGIRADGATQIPGSLAQRLLALGKQTRHQQAHFGVSIEDDGEVLHLVDETGAHIADPIWLAMAAHEAAGDGPDGKAFLTFDGSPYAIGRDGTDAIDLSCVTSREEMHAALVEGSAQVGGDADGRLWFVEKVPIADALRGLALLLTMLSRRDLPLSRVATERLAEVGRAG